jgi:hypothetical protein
VQQQLARSVGGGAHRHVAAVGLAVLAVVDLPGPFDGWPGGIACIDWFEVLQQCHAEGRTVVGGLHVAAAGRHRAVAEDLGDGAAQRGAAGRDFHFEVAVRGDPAAARIAARRRLGLRRESRGQQQGRGKRVMWTMNRWHWHGGLRIE